MVKLIGTPIGNLSDITFRAKRELEEAEVILAEDTRVAQRLLQLLQIPTNSKKIYNCNRFVVFKTLQKLGVRFLNSHRVVFISDAGMPGISDPGAEIVQFCRRNQVDYEVVPGVSAVVTAFSASGFEGGFWFVGFLPSKGIERQRKLEEVLNSSTPVVLFEAPHRLEKLLFQLAQLEPERELFLGKELTKKFETYLFGKAEELVEVVGKSGKEKNGIGKIKSFSKSIKKENSKLGNGQDGENRNGKTEEDGNGKESGKGDGSFITLKGEWVVVISGKSRRGKGKDKFQREKGGEGLFLTYREIELLPLPPRVKAKLLSKISGISPKEIYQKLISDKT